MMRISRRQGTATTYLRKKKKDKKGIKTELHASENQALLVGLEKCPPCPGPCSSRCRWCPMTLPPAQSSCPTTSSRNSAYRRATGALDVVVRQGTAILELFPGEDETTPRPSPRSPLCPPPRRTSWSGHWAWNLVRMLAISPGSSANSTSRSSGATWFRRRSREAKCSRRAAS